MHDPSGIPGVPTTRVERGSCWPQLGQCADRPRRLTGCAAPSPTKPTYPNPPGNPFMFGTEVAAGKKTNLLKIPLFGGEKVLLRARPWWVHLAHILTRLGTKSLPPGRGKLARAQQRGGGFVFRRIRAPYPLPPPSWCGGLRLAA